MILQVLVYLQVFASKSVSIQNFSSPHFPHANGIQRDMDSISIFSANAGKYRQEKLEIRTLSTQ